MKLNLFAKRDNVLKVIAFVVTMVFAILMLFPLLYMLSNSLKDNLQIYSAKPSFIPKNPKVLSLVLDYTDEQMSENELLDQILRDSTVSMYATDYEMNKQSIAEFRVYGLQGGKVIYYAHANKNKLKQELNFGIYRGIVVSTKTLLANMKYRTWSDDIGYQFDLQGVNRSYNADQIGQFKLDGDISVFLPEKYEVKGKFVGTTMHSDFMLLIKNFGFYYQIPKLIYSSNHAIAHFSFFVFLYNSVIVIGFAVIVQVLLCSVTAYPLSRLLPAIVSKIILLYFLGTLMVPFVVTMIPQFVMFKRLGMYDNYAALLVPFLLPYGFYVFLFKSFFDQLPKDLFEAARIDGAGEFYLFVRVCMPLSKPIIALIGLQTFLSNQNDFFWAWLVTERQELWTLNVALYQLSRVPMITDNYMMGLGLMTLIPVLLITILFSEQIKRSIASSGIKG